MLGNLLCWEPEYFQWEKKWIIHENESLFKPRALYMYWNYSWHNSQPHDLSIIKYDSTRKCNPKKSGTYRCNPILLKWMLAFMVGMPFVIFPLFPKDPSIPKAVRRNSSCWPCHQLLVTIQNLLMNLIEHIFNYLADWCTLNSVLYCTIELYLYYLFNRLNLTCLLNSRVKECFREWMCSLRNRYGFYISSHFLCL